MPEEVNDEMEEIVVCKYCGGNEKYGEMMWLNGRNECRKCYKIHYNEVIKKLHSDENNQQ